MTALGLGAGAGGERGTGTCERRSSAASRVSNEGLQLLAQQSPAASVDEVTSWFRTGASLSDRFARRSHRRIDSDARSASKQALDTKKLFAKQHQRPQTS